MRNTILFMASAVLPCSQASLDRAAVTDLTPKIDCLSQTVLVPLLASPCLM